MKENFNIILLAVIFDPKEKKILIGKGNLDPYSLTGWCFPGCKIKQEEDLDKKLKEKIKEQTGHDVKNLGSIFVRIPKKEPDKFIVYFLCESISDMEQAGDGIKELKWIDPKNDLEEYFTTNMNTRLKNYLKSLGPSSF